MRTRGTIDGRVTSAGFAVGQGCRRMFLTRRSYASTRPFDWVVAAGGCPS
jgi:hypothetical protein